jgi:serine/threonine-protein kinase
VVSGAQLGRYTLLGKIATGGMAEVFLARQEGPQGFAKTLVVKRILPHLAKDENFVRMFLDEARLAAVINHPNVVSIFELGQDAETNSYYMAMEYIDGCNLKRVVHDAVRARSRFPPELSARVIADACAGLDYAHNLKGENRQPLNIVHRDISPENILITYSGLVKVVDFGIAKAASIEGRTQAGQVKGKFGYMPPEQLLGQPLDRRADVWALGVVLYWMCSGVKPFGGENEAVIIQKILGSEPEPLDNRVPGLPRRLAEIVHAALAKDPNQRYESARALQQDLEAWLAADGLVASSAALSDYMNARFPETTDRDRMLVRALQSGELQQATPSDTDLLVPFKSASHTVQTNSQAAALNATQLGQDQFDEIKPPSQVRQVLIAGVVGGVVATAAAALVFSLRPSAKVLPLPPPRTQVVQTPPPLNPVPAVAVPPAVAPPTPAVAPPPAPALPAPVSPTPAAAPQIAPAAPTTAAAPSPPQAADPTTADVKSAPRKKGHHHAAAAAAAPEDESTTTVVKESGGAEGTITFRVSPWATVYLDGQRIGTTPLQPIDVPAGSHQVRLVNDPLHAEKNLTINVKAGEPAVVKAMLGEE